MSKSTATAQKHTPFDDILTLEKRQEERVKAELEKIDAAERAESERLKEEEHHLTETARASAREDLTAFKNKELPSLLQKSEASAAEERGRIERAGSAKKQSVIASLTERMLSDDTLSRL